MKYTLILSVLFSFYCSAEWVDNWFDNAIYEKPSSYNTQKRGYYSAGSFSARVNSSTEYPLTISAPKLSIGCGGIDAFAGGIAFLDSDYLVEKMQGVMQAAPYIALDMAMKTMCKECSDSLNKAEQIANYLNNIQLNECEMGKPMVATMFGENKEGLMQAWGEATGATEAAEGITRLWTESKEKVGENDNKPTRDLKKQIRGCSREFKDLMKSGSLISKVTKKTGMEEYADLLRGYFGDVIIKASSSDKIPTARRMLGCSQNKDSSFDDMMEGNVYIKKEDGSCSKNSSQKSVRKIVSDKLTDIAAKIQTGRALNSSEEDFIFLSPRIPIYSILVDSVRYETVNDDIGILTDVVSVYYTYLIYDDLYRNVAYALRSADNAMKEAKSDPSANPKDKCNTDIYREPMDKFNELLSKANDRREQIKIEYQRIVSDETKSNAFVRMFSERNENIRKERTKRGSGI